MKRFSLQFICALFILSFSAPAYAGGGHDHGHDEHGHDKHGHEHGHEGQKEETTKGPHGGKMFQTDDFALELTIFEDGVPPQFRIYPYLNKKLIEPKEIISSITLERFARAKETFELTPKETFLTSAKTVEEPHSFKVGIEASYAGKKYEWTYESHEGRTELSKEALKVADITIEEVSSQNILSNIRVYGRLLPNEDRVVHVYPRFSGIIKQITKKLGDDIKQGDLLAVVESNQSLQPYEIRSQISGKLIKRHATLGEFVPDSKEIFVVADLSEIWADFQVYRDDFGPIKEGQNIEINLGNDGTTIPATVSYVSPTTDIATQSKFIRAILPNVDGMLRPGLFVSGMLSSNASKVNLAVKREAIQTFRDWTVVYLTDGHSFQAMPVELGKKDKTWVEVLTGLNAGDRYVTKNSFIIKADVEKSGASHDH